MKKTLIALLLLSSLCYSVRAQITDSAVKRLMTKRTLDCTDIYYNAITLIPQLYREGKTDTINAIINYTHRNCDVYTATVAYLLLRSIQTHTFRESIDDYCIYHDRCRNTDSLTPIRYYEKNIIGLLNSYILDAKTNNNTLQHPPVFAAASREYTNFIKAMALSLITRNDLSPAEKFIIGVYGDPESARFGVLKSSIYKGSLLQKAYNKTIGDNGMEYSLSVGRWKPFGNLALLGDHPTVGCFLGARENGFSGGVSFSVAFGKSPSIYRVKKNDSVFNTDRFVQYYIGYDIAQALYSTRRTELTLGAGLGYDGINALKNTDKHHARTLGSFNWNLGAGFKVFLLHHEHNGSISHSYIGVQAKYNFVSYNNRGGTDLGGRSACITLIFGGFTFDRPVHYETMRRTRFRCWG